MSWITPHISTLKRASFPAITVIKLCFDPTPTCPTTCLSISPLKCITVPSSRRFSTPAKPLSWPVDPIAGTIQEPSMRAAQQTGITLVIADPHAIRNANDYAKHPDQEQHHQDDSHRHDNTTTATNYTNSTPPTSCDSIVCVTPHYPLRSVWSK
mmetsp:Transcript_7997/g.11680  ORF Transcript_7997/g.11680 Transcript_7997/m.11680 type:complete len:154 (-) Transcript_7997:186-647(-)